MESDLRREELEQGGKLLPAIKGRNHPECLTGNSARRSFASFKVSKSPWRGQGGGDVHEYPGGDREVEMFTNTLERMTGRWRCSRIPWKEDDREVEMFTNTKQK